MLGDIRRPRQDPQGPSSGAVRVELQAHCFAGLWAHYATSTPAPDGGDPGSWTHGSSEMRRQWFLTGYDQGSMQACDTFRAQL